MSNNKNSGLNKYNIIFLFATIRFRLCALSLQKLGSMTSVLSPGKTNVYLLFDINM